ncbi:FRG domain-containing protein [Bacillus sp. CCB-MMP212]|uniref:FRG domain-containing protein n=1 Tax=Bacillus sp. CCB-MMP212 TaxID=2928002 RepID=UPI001F601EF5|nr:FRG domain-containing protein [Bacillus sp. CCB-MMP212]MCI4250556.1 FRG domain-containing protein [Bacillus sp. CCB-MMP212]
MSNWIWFRGHSDENYKLNSGLFRTENKNKKLILEEYLFIENQLIVNFKQQSSTFIREDNIDLQFHMQHHGLKTRLLDWTDSFATALYFAFEGWDYDKETNACIWLLDPYALHTHLQGVAYIETADSIRDIDEEDIDGEIRNLADVFTNTVAEYTFPMYPSKNNARLLVQNGYFTVQSNRLEDLEVELEQACPKNKEKILKKIILSPDLLESIYEYLTLNGVNHFTVYNDVDGLSKYLNKELTENAYDEKLKHIAKFSNFSYMTNRYDL